MTASTPLEQALIAWRRDQNSDRQVRADDAVALGETGLFSVRNISHITGLDERFISGLLFNRTVRTGGRLNPEALPMIYDIWLQWARAQTFSVDELRRVIRFGVSVGMLSKLTGIPRSTLYHRTAPEPTRLRSEEDK